MCEKYKWQYWLYEFKEKSPVGRIIFWLINERSEIWGVTLEENFPQANVFQDVKTMNLKLESQKEEKDTRERNNIFSGTPFLFYKMTKILLSIFHRKKFSLSYSEI